MVKYKIAILGLGYVGLPLAVEFGKHFPVVGYDLNHDRIRELREGSDATREVSKAKLKSAKHLVFTYDENDLADCNVFVVTVPTPVDRANQPDLYNITQATSTAARYLKKGNTVVFESTVFPGATEEVCVPILERESGLVFNQDFFVGYSPERINPGDKQHDLTHIVKITSGSNERTADFVDELYSEIISAGTYKAGSIKVAEAAKVIENTQRDLNIALVNEFAIIFNLLGIDTREVLEAAGTKWNFLKFRPGLVGGHCIGVDPYYLTFKAKQLGYHPEVISAGRRINDSMGKYVGQEFVKLMSQREISLNGAKVLILGLTFKEDCGDIRNTHVVDIIDALSEHCVGCDVYDPWVNPEHAKYLPNVNLVDSIDRQKYQGVIIAVQHKEFIEMGVQALRDQCVEGAPIYDLKSIFSKEQTDGRL